MSIVLQGVCFLAPGHAMYQQGRKVIVRLTINPSAGNLATVDAGEGAQVSGVVVPVTALTLTRDDGVTLSPGVSTPATASCTFGYVQGAYATSGDRVVSASITLTGVSASPVKVSAFTPYGTVFSAPPAPTPPANTAIPGTGLLGRYFGNPDLTGSPAFEVVEQPYIEDGTAEPHPGVPRIFSARWTGRIKALGAGAYRFKVRVDDGVRLYLDGRLALDFWSDQNNKERLTGYYTYTAGQLVTVWLEFYNGSRLASMQFSWETPGAQFELVPVTSLYSTDGTEALPAALAPPNQTKFYSTTVQRY